MKLVPKIVIISLLVLIIFFFGLGVYDVFFGGNYYPVAYEEEIKAASEEFGVEEHIIYATIYCESSFDKNAVSNMDAHGLMQLLPSTFEWLAGRECTEEELHDPALNILYGTKYLSILYKRYNNWDMAHAAYHAGNGRVDKWIEEGEVVVDADGRLTGIPIRATEVYVEKVNSAKEKYIEILEKEEK